MAASAIRNLRAHCGLWLHRWRAHHSLHLVLRRDGAGGFAHLGPPRRIAAFARAYLDEETLTNLDISTVLRPWGKAASARHHARAVGLAVLAPGTAPASLQPDLVRLDSFINLVIPLPASLETYVASLNHSARSDLRSIRKNGYHSAFDRDPAWVRPFLDLYHLPSIQGRHSDDGHCASPQELEDLLATGNAEWIRIFDRETCVAACLCERRSGRYLLHRLGWFEGSPAILAKGAIGALYWFAIRHAIETGCDQVTLGGTRPDLQNGLFGYKTKWGARLAPTTRKFETFGLLLDPAHPDAHRFLATRSLLLHAVDGRHTVLSGRLPSEVSAATAQSDFLSAWFRLRDQPSNSAASAPANQPLPHHLRPWFDAIPLPAPAPPPPNTQS